MRAPSAISGLVALVALSAGLSAFATEQVRDPIVISGHEGTLLERPLNNYLRRLREIPKFDIRSTANYKGYIAGWEIKDSRLILASFHATTNLQPYSISSLFPGRLLPIVADWHSGAIHIVSGRESLARGHYTYEQVITLQITNGLVIATNRMTNVRDDRLKK